MDRLFRGVGLLLVLFIFLSCFAFALDETEKAYLDGLTQKETSQISAKIDAQTNRIEANLKTSVEQAKAQITEEVSAQLKESLKGVAIGLVGLIIITLAIFKVVDLRISSTRNIKKYEKILQEKKDELNKLIMLANNERNELAITRFQMIEFQKKLQAWEKEMAGVYGQPSFGQTNMNVPQAHFPSSFPQPPKLEGKKGINWRNVAIIVLLILALLFGIVAYYQIFVVK